MPRPAATVSQWRSNTDLLWCCGCCRFHSSGLRCTSEIIRFTASSASRLPDMDGTRVTLPIHYSYNRQCVRFTRTCNVYSCSGCVKRTGCRVIHDFGMAPYVINNNNNNARAIRCVCSRVSPSDVYHGDGGHTRVAATAAAAAASPNRRQRRRRPPAPPQLCQREHGHRRRTKSLGCSRRIVPAVTLVVIITSPIPVRGRATGLSPPPQTPETAAPESSPNPVGRPAAQIECPRRAQNLHDFSRLKHVRSIPKCTRRVCRLSRFES